MNTKLLLIAGMAAGLALQLSPSVMANPITASATPNALIPDNNLNGLASSINLNSEGAHAITAITSVTVTVDVTGDPNAWNGDYYCYLEYDSTLVVLLNNLGGGTIYPPSGTPGNGMDVTFSQSAAQNVSSAPGLNSSATLTGTYQPQVGSLNAFNGLAPAGTWTLFVADESAGGVGKLASWSLDVTGLPDTGGTMTLLGMGVGFMGLCSLNFRAPRLLS